jgi:hypothetical protein
MIKKGDKVFCIKEQEYIFYDGNRYTHLRGNIYEVLNIRVSDKILFIQTQENYNDINGLWFSLDDNNHYRKTFSDYFITLAEWRDKQIDSILED